MSAPPAFVARCPAKINLALRVLGRRADGYHEIDTLFQTIDLWDRIEVRAHHDLVLECDDPRIPVDGRNLVLRAAAQLRGWAGLSGRGAAFSLFKCIPPEAGLGGGSSDAAGTLRLCAALWGLDPDAPALDRLAAELGADVPFFLRGGTARGRGRGDIIEPLEFLGRRGIVLGMPPFGVSTSEAYAALGSPLTHPGNGVSFRAVSAHKWREDKDFSSAVNDLENVVFPRWPELGRFCEALRGVGAQRALMSGSGSTVYGLFEDRADVRAIAAELGSRFDGWKVLATQTVDAAAHVVPRLRGSEGEGAWRSPR